MLYCGLFLILFVNGAGAQVTSFFATNQLYTSPQCSHGSLGLCGYGSLCPAGSTCQRSWSLFGFGVGHCCRTSQFAVSGQCLYGEAGICGGIAGFQCPPQSTCTGVASYPDAAGKCCRNFNFASQQTCPYGETGDSCGGLLGQQCPYGSTCVLPSNYIADAPGKCCRNTFPFAVSGGTCPPYQIRPCYYRVNQCIVDTQCPLNTRCCLDACGTICKPRIYY